MKYSINLFLFLILLFSCERKTENIVVSTSSLESINKLDTATFLLLRERKWNVAADSANMLITKSEQVNYPKGIATGYKWLGMTKLLTGDTEQAKIALEKGYEAIKEVSEEYPLKIYFALRLAQCYSEAGEHLKEMQVLATALKLIKLTNNPKTSVDLNNYLGNYHIDKLNLDSAIIHLIEAFQASEEIPNFDSNKSSIALNLGKALVARGNYKDAKEYFDISYKIKAPNNEIRDSNGVAALYLNYETLYSKQDSTELAIEYATKAYKLTNLTNNHRLNINAAANLAGLLILKKEYTQSSKYINEAIDGAKNINNNYLLCGSYSNMGILQQKYFKNLKKAEKYILQSLTMADSSGFQDLKLNAYDYLSKVYFDKKEYDKAYVMLDSFVNFSAEIFEEESLMTIDSLTKVYQVYRKDAENKLLKTDNDLKAASLNTANFRTALALSIILLIFIILIIIYYSRRQHIKQNKQLGIVNQELNITNNKLIIAHKDLQGQHEEIKGLTYELRDANKLLQLKNEELNQTIEIIQPIDKSVNIGQRKQISSSKIFYIEVQGNNSYFYSNNGKELSNRKISLNKLIAELPTHFIRLNQSIIVNLTKVELMEGKQKVRLNEEITLDIKDEKTFLAAFKKYHQ